MAGLNHDFMVVEKSIALQKSLSYDLVLNNQDKVVMLHDDLIAYFTDSLRWLNGDGIYGPYDIGINYYSDTIFSTEKCLKLKKILQAWHDLFLCAPENIRLTGRWTTIVGEENSGEYDKITLQRDALLKNLQDIIALCTQVENDENLVLVHFGI